MCVRATVLAMTIGCAVFGQTPGENPPAAEGDPGQPQLFVKNRAFEMGRVREGDKVRASFPIHNRGGSSLQIIQVKASCGCTVPKHLSREDKLLEPGETLDIEVEFDSKGRLGKQYKTITVSSTDPIEPHLQLTLSGEVVTLMEVLVDGRLGGTVSLKRALIGAPIDTKIEVLPTDPDRSVEIQSIELRHDALSFETVPLAKDTRNGFEIVVSSNTDAVPGPISAELHVQAKVDGRPVSQRLRISGEIVGELSFLPNELRQTAPMIRGSRLIPVKIRSESRQPFELLSIDVHPSITYEIRPHKDMIEYALIPSIGMNAPPGPLGTAFTIRSNNVAQPSIVIPVFINVRAAVEAYPPAVYLRRDGTPASQQRTIRVESATRAKFDITAITADSPYVTAQVDSTRPKEVGLYPVTIALAEQAPSGRHEVAVRIQTTLDGAPEIVVPVTVESP